MKTIQLIAAIFTAEVPENAGGRLAGAIEFGLGREYPSLFDAVFRIRFV